MKITNSPSAVQKVNSLLGKLTRKVWNDWVQCWANFNVRYELISGVLFSSSFALVAVIGRMDGLVVGAENPLRLLHVLLSFQHHPPPRVLLQPSRINHVLYLHKTLRIILIKYQKYRLPYSLIASGVWLVRFSLPLPPLHDTHLGHSSENWGPLGKLPRLAWGYSKLCCRLEAET